MTNNMENIWNIESIDTSFDKTIVRFINGIDLGGEQLERYNRWIANAYKFQVEIDWRDPREVWITRKRKD